MTAYHASAVFKYNGSTGALETSYGKGVLRGPVGITCGPDGDMYIASYKDNQVMRFSPSGRFIGVAAGTTEQRMGAQRRSAAARRPFARATTPPPHHRLLPPPADDGLAAAVVGTAPGHRPAAGRGGVRW